MFSAPIRAMFAVAVAVLAVGHGAAASAEVNLEWRASSRTIRVGDTVGVGLYAVSHDGSDQAFAGLYAIVGWDPLTMRLVGRRDDGPYDWMDSSFPNDLGLDGLNADCGASSFCNPYSGLPFSDGDALYQAIAWPGLDPVPYATPEGFLVTTLLFSAQMETAETGVRFMEAVDDTDTIVLGAQSLGDVTGELVSVTLTIVACGSAGDLDGDCEVTLSDLALFGMCLTGPEALPGGPVCDTADLDGDGDADLRDFAALQILFEGR